MLLDVIFIANRNKLLKAVKKALLVIFDARGPFY